MRYGYDYSELDDLIESKIESGIRRFKDLLKDTDLAPMLEKYRGDEALPWRERRPAERVLDARLQAMKRQWRIHYDQDNGWWPTSWRKGNVSSL